MTQRRRFTADFKAQVVLELVSGAKSAAELCRYHQLNPQLLGGIGGAGGALKRRR